MSGFVYTGAFPGTDRFLYGPAPAHAAARICPDFWPFAGRVVRHSLSGGSRLGRGGGGSGFASALGPIRPRRRDRRAAAGRYGAILAGPVVGLGLARLSAGFPSIRKRASCG